MYKKSAFNNVLTTYKPAKVEALSYGSIVQQSGDFYVVGSCGHHDVVLTSLRSGYRWGGPYSSMDEAVHQLGDDAVVLPPGTTITIVVGGGNNEL